MSISRYRTPVGSEVEVQFGSRGRVLRNLPGLTSKREIDLLEYQELVAVQHHYLQIISATTRFDATMICQMHGDWLHNIYTWAGEYRTVEMEKDGFKWPPAFRIMDNMERFSNEILTVHTPCNSIALSAICHSLAVVHAELLFIHPFREGNGRVARWLADLMAAQAGLPLPDYRLAGRGAKITGKRYISAVQQGYVNNYEPLTAFFEEALRRAM